VKWDGVRLFPVAHLRPRAQFTYLLAQTKKKAGFQRLALVTEVPNAELVAADSIFVSEAK